ncbi:BnaC06g23240D [Brassica napus]|uniref:BnaC06g23240D protein n=1 Tax=Brassica napus TaxID=3708 RepID=A0A078FDL2_BRANA|nr:BnaC06g23240D [Brassica napus]
MEGKLFLGQYLILVILLLGQLHGYISCIEKERVALLDLKKYTIASKESNQFLTTWTNVTKIDCCQWEKVKCDRASGRVIRLSIGFSGLFDDVEGYKSLRRLRNLEIVDLFENAFDNSIFPFINAATSLRTLLLPSNNMDGLFPAKELKDLTNLEVLDLSEYRFNSSIPLGDFHALRNLKALDLHGICELKNLEELNLSQNKLVGQFPLCLLSFNGLRVLDLSSNQLNEKLPSAIRNLESLEYLSLSNNNFKGSFSLGLLANLSKLRVFRLDSKGNSLQVESGSFWKPKFQLNVIALPSCNLKKVPHFLLHQKDLRHVDLSDNNISGTFPSWLLVNNTKLENLHLQNNFIRSFQLPESDHNLHWLDFSVNKLTGLLPESIGWILPDLSFHGKLPRAFVEGCYSLVILKLSYNKLSGEIFQESVNFTGVNVLFLDNNHFTGRIGHGLRRLINLSLLDISNNNLTGVIPSWIGELPVSALLLSNNSLEGEIPISLVSISSLIRLLDLSANSLSGAIPPHVNSGTSVVLLLQDNNLSGVIPNTLLLNVSLLDLRNNRFYGNIPEFISNERTSFLLLRGNNLTGQIPSQLCSLTSIHFLDLANNRLSGSIPSCLSNISSDLRKVYATIYDFGIESLGLSQLSYLDRDSISTRDVGTYFKSLLILDQFTTYEYDVRTQTKIGFATKGRFDAYMGGNLGYLIGMDLSDNELSGEIPVELGGPKELQGRIPPQLAELSSLAVFNVSYNNLLGAIPLGRQFNTFETRSYLGNPRLCGKPTNISCKSNNFQEADDGLEEDESTIDMKSFYYILVAAYVTILIGIFASFSFDSPWSRFWFYSVDAFIYKARSWLWCYTRCSGLGDNTLCHAIARDGDVVMQTILESPIIPDLRLKSIILDSSSFACVIKFIMEGKMSLGKYLTWVILLLGQLHGYQSCVQKESIALLELKRYIISITEEGESNSVFPTWTNDTNSNCCHWEGLECNRTSKRVTDIAFGTLHLKESSLLNLSLLHPFEEIRKNEFNDDAFNQFSGLFDDVEGHNSLSRLRNLEILDFSSNKFNNSIFPFLSAATSLTTLFLRGNNLDGPSPLNELKELTNLKLLDLSDNRFNGSIPVQELSTLSKLEALDVSDNELSGSMELQGKLAQIFLIKHKIWICKLKNLQELDLSRNKLSGQFPLCLTNLTGLRVLDLSSNQMTGKVPSALGSLESLEYLSLFDNNFEGFFSVVSFANFSELRVLKLGSLSNSLQVESASSWKPKFQLNVIVLRSCNLEKVPYFLLHQKGLRQVDLSHNKIPGDFPSWLMENNTELKVLTLQNNNFTSFQLPQSAHDILMLDMSVNGFSHLFPGNIGLVLPHLASLNISNNRFQGDLPSSLGFMKSIQFLDISHNSFHGKLQRSFVEGCYSLRILKLSHNKLSGEILPSSTNFTHIWELSMDNNLFTGKIGQGLRKLEYLLLLDISNNNLTGVIPSWIGELSSLNAILLSNNLLEGEVHVSLFNISNLLLLDLSANILSGGIPPHVSSANPVALFLQDNNLSGSIPATLLVNVTILDLRNNRLSGNIPEFVNTQNISILLLRGNNLTGHIPHQLCGLRNIHLLDLADNKLNGSIPSCLSHTSFGLGKEDMSYDYDFKWGYMGKNDGRHFKSLLVLDPINWYFMHDTQTKIEFATKHRYDAYMGGILKYMFGLDLSENELAGEIPVELGDLLELYALNFSHNYLSGVIPKSFSGLKNVESLDLSFNRLEGRIPAELTELSRLAVFKVTYNNLSGAIPQGKQFNTFDIQSYLGNPLLCGKPTNKSCETNNIQEPDNEVEADESTIDMVSFYWSIVAAYVTVLLGILAFLSIDSPWSRAWFYIVDVFIRKPHGYKSCILKERNALLDLKKFLISTTEEGQSEPVLPTWTNDTTSDCCQWERVKCNSTSGRVLELSIRGLNLKKSSLLNFSLLHPFEEVQSVDLSESKFGGFFDGPEGYKSLSRLRNLEILDLSSNKFNISVFPFLNAATSLTTLLLQGNNMSSPFPAKELSALVKLKFLDLSGNGFSGSMELQGKSVHSFKFSIKVLDLSQNYLVGDFPLCLTGLTGLRVLDLSSNQMSGKIPSSLANLESLEYFSLFDNNFEGFFSLDSLANLSMLKVFGVNSRSNSFQVVSDDSWKPKFQLNAIALRSCNLEKVPDFLLHQKDLRHVDLSNNNISGQFPSWLLANNTKLDNIGWILPHLLSLNISKNGFQGSMPSSLGNMKSINNLDISHNSFGGKLPRSFVEGCYSLSILKLSHNKLSGEAFPESTNFTRVSQLSMDNNQFTGTIGQGLRRLRSLYMLDVSHNNLTGGIPSWIGQNQFLGALQLSNNMLEGEIPPSLFNIFSLRLLDLSGNGLSGGLPSEINTFLANVVVLDLRNNRLSGNIPEFINTQTTNILLRGNNLTGRIPRQLCGLSNIHLLDLANNRLSGSIPSCLSNTSLGLGKEDAPYSYSLGVAVVAPGDSTSTDSFSYLSLKIGGILNYLYGLDLSENELTGEIPSGLGDLLKLRALNLSHNYLSGVVPATFSGIRNLESLDLSFNRLHGWIPPQLTALSSLAVFNVSYNNLSGVIPQGKQFNTFDTQSYLGNLLLCGQPTNTSCKNVTSPESDNEVKDDDSLIDMVSFYWSSAATYVTILIGLFASLSFDSPWSRFWFYIVEVFINKVRNLLCLYQVLEYHMEFLEAFGCIWSSKEVFKAIIGRAEQGSEVPQRRHEVAPKHLSERPSWSDPVKSLAILTP